MECGYILTESKAFSYCPVEVQSPGIGAGALLGTPASHNVGICHSLWEGPHGPVAKNGLRSSSSLGFMYWFYHTNYLASLIIIKIKNLCRGGPAQIKPVIFKGQLNFWSVFWNPSMQRAQLVVIRGFLTAAGLAPFTPVLFKGQLFCLFFQE